MSEYVNKRVEYINNWPNVSPFKAEDNYKQRCDNFIAENSTQPFLPLKLWIDNDVDYNKSISHFIDSLDVMPYRPNFAFTFIFSALDYYGKNKYPNPHSNRKMNTTISFKLMIEDFSYLAKHNNDVKDIFSVLFSTIPVNATIYLYKCLHSGLSPTNKAYKRVTNDINDNCVSARKNIIDSIYVKYGYDTRNYDSSIRHSALLYRKIFEKDTIVIDGITVPITDEFRLHLLLSGIIYSLRNDSLHGSSMSSTKSSKTTPERYALNFYCYLATYTLFMILLIVKSTMSNTDKNMKYKELKDNITNNVKSFRNLFGNHI